MRKISIKDIAREAGVSNATVSLVLNGKEKEGRVSKEVAARVKQIASDLDYQPNSLAKSLKSGHSYMSQQDMIILAQPALAEQAERLANAHRTHDNLSVQVVQPEKVYNEFSSGTPDASAIRRFMKMFYDRKSSDTDAPKYLLLLGDGSFDNRQLTTNWKQVDMTNMLLTYQTQESLNDESYVADDYFAYLDDANDAKSFATKDVNIGVGRFPVRTLSEATAAVDKVITYMNNTQYGTWLKFCKSILMIFQSKPQPLKS